MHARNIAAGHLRGSKRKPYPLEANEAVMFETSIILPVFENENMVASFETVAQTDICRI